MQTLDGGKGLSQQRLNALLIGQLMGKALPFS